MVELEKIWDAHLIQRCLDNAYEIEGIDKYSINDKEMIEICMAVKSVLGYERLNPEYLFIDAVRKIYEKTKDKREEKNLGEYGEVEEASPYRSYSDEPMRVSIPSPLMSVSSGSVWSQPVVLGLEHGVTFAEQAVETANSMVNDTVTVTIANG